MQGRVPGEGRPRDLTAEIAENAEKRQRSRERTAKRPMLRQSPLPDAAHINRITDGIIGAAIEVHRHLGPGLLESAYEACLAYEMSQRKLQFERQKPLPLVYREVKLDCGYRLDFLVEGLVVVELKAIDALLPLHDAQLISYLKLTGCPAGLLINFHARLLKAGIRRLVNHFPDQPPKVDNAS